MNFNLILKTKNCLCPAGEQWDNCRYIFFWDNLEERAALHNAQSTNSDARRREQKFALPRARRRQPLFLFGRAE